MPTSSECTSPTAHVLATVTPARLVQLAAAGVSVSLQLRGLALWLSCTSRLPASPAGHKRR